MNVRTNRITRLLALTASLVLTAGLLSSCSSSPASSSGSTVNAPAVSVPVLITDAPSDQLVAFSLTINSIVLNGSKGQATVLSTPTTIEICHLNGIQAPLVTANIPQDTYTSAVITFSNPQITYINSAGAAVTVSPTLTTTSFTYTFPTPGPFTVSGSSGALLFDLIASQSVNIVGTTVTVNPIFEVKPVPAATAAPPPGQNGTGMQQMATVVSVSGTSLTLEPGSGPNFTVTTNSSTVLQGFTALSALTAGELVQVDFVVSGACAQQLSSTVQCSPPVLLATRIQLAPPAATGQPPISLLSGPVTSVSPGSFKMVLMQGVGPTVPVSATAVSLLTVNTNSSTVWAIAPQFVALTGLPFTPSFSPTNLVAGQTVSVIASSVSTVPPPSATAASVTLIPQTLGGTVTAIKTVGGWTAYTLSLPSGSAFAALSSASTITVYTNANTAPPPPTPVGATTPPAIAVSSVVRFNGLVFNTGGGTFAMVAGCSPDGPPGI